VRCGRRLIFLVEARERSIGEKGFEEAGDALGDFGAITEDFEHVGDDAAGGEERVLDFLGFWGSGVAFE